MGFWEALDKFKDFMDNTVLPAADKMTMDNVKRAERDYKAGKISFEKYTQIINNSADYLSKRADHEANKNK